MNYRKFIRNFSIFAIIFLALIALVVYIFDPFFHYHKPIRPLKAVVTLPEHQCIGTIRNFEYDNLVLGSSIAENYNNHWFDEAFGGTTIKAIQHSGKTMDLLYYFNESVKNHELKNVFYSIDFLALYTETRDYTFPTDSMPIYLYNDNIADDFKYLWNKDVLFEHIPYMVAMSLIGEYDEGTSYNWCQYKKFTKEGTLLNYFRRDDVLPMKTQDDYKYDIDINISLIEKTVKENPSITFRFIFPPYSILKWEDAYMFGELDAYFYATQTLMETLLKYENVEIYYFQNDENIIYNLDNYMDTMHFSDQINKYIVDEMALGHYRIIIDNYENEIELMKKLAYEYIDNPIYKN